ncbi:MAG TPA: GNAT family N-acetyltransferase [Anaerolineales bacterium]|nr:GNAT family N-acetyltransferase [Anaerolineales bacterium]
MADTVILETQRLILRRFHMSDLDDLVAFYNDPDVTRYIPDAPRNPEETKQELEWFLNGHPRFPELGLWATIYKETGKFIGRCGLLPWTIDGQDEVEVAFAFSKAYWGQGLATEAAQALVRHGFEHLKLSRLICLIVHDNKASIRVATKLGMTFEREAKDEYGPFLIYAVSNQPKIV